MNPWLALVLQLEPMVPGLIGDIKSIFTKHNITDPAQQTALIQSLVNAAMSTDDDTLAKIAADQKAHGG